MVRYDINYCAVDLLQSINNFDNHGLGQRPLHLAAYSTGSSVVKRALVLAGIDQRYLHIDKSCYQHRLLGRTALW